MGEIVAYTYTTHIRLMLSCIWILILNIWVNKCFVYPPGLHNLMYHRDKKNESKDQECNKQSIFIEFHSMFNIL